jgi:methylenetetrahydrofolate--tRNA-(uracil-5-)-methyltransferase
MRRLGSIVMRAAEDSRVPAGAALAVDRERFAETITRAMADHPLITVVREEVTAIPESGEREPVIVCTGPLTSDALSADIAALVGGEHLASTMRSARLSCRHDRPVEGVSRSRWDRVAVGLACPAEAGRHRYRWRPPSGDQPACGIDDGRATI